MNPGIVSEGQWLYAFAIAQVQRYLLARPRLREIQGGSQLLEQLCTEVFDKARRAAGLRDDQVEVLSQAAAAVRLLATNREAVATLYALWPFIVDSLVPGARLEQALLPVDGQGLGAAIARLGEQLQASRAWSPEDLPVPPPVVERNPQTSLPVEHVAAIAGEVHRLDRASWAKEKARDDLARSTERRSSRLDQRVLGDLESEYRFVTGAEMEEEDYLTGKDETYVALIHADGNEVGKAVHALLGAEAAQESGRRIKEFSEALSSATRNAAQTAAKEVLVPAGIQPAGAGDRRVILPARPVVLGGDDLTLLVNCRLALRYAEVFLAEFETLTGEEFRKREVPIAKGLTACAGVVFVKPHFPFDRAHDLATTLCDLAKRHVKAASPGAPGSAVSFLRVTGSLPMDAEAVLRELTRENHRLTMEAYAVGTRPAGGLPTMTELRDLAQAMPSRMLGRIRTLLPLMYESPERANEEFQRVLEVARQRDARRPEARGPDVRGFETALAALTGPANGVVPLWRAPDPVGLRRSPLDDAYTVRLMEASGERGEA